MRTQNRVEPMPDKITEASMAVVWGLMGVVSITYAMTHSGISEFMGWVALVSACLLFYSNSVSGFSQGRELLLKQGTSFVGQILLAVIFAAQMIALAGIWDAR